MAEISRELVVILLVVAVVLSFVSTYMAFSTAGNNFVQRVLGNDYGGGTVSLYVHGAPIEAAGQHSTVSVDVIDNKNGGLI